MIDNITARCHFGLTWHPADGIDPLIDRMPSCLCLNAMQRCLSYSWKSQFHITNTYSLSALKGDLRSLFQNMWGIVHWTITPRISNS